MKKKLRLNQKRIFMWVVLSLIIRSLKRTSQNIGGIFHLLTSIYTWTSQKWWKFYLKTFLACLCLKSHHTLWNKLMSKTKNFKNKGKLVGFLKLKTMLNKGKSWLKNTNLSNRRRESLVPLIKMTSGKLIRQLLILL